jgi:outer membrane receptor protein involved in Fe transport
VFVRANSNALKGQNAERTKLHGVSVSAEQEMFPFTFKQHVYLSNTVDPKFKSGLPFEPWALANAAAEFQASSNLATGAEVHFKSEYIRDVSGDSISPQTYQVDSFLRYEWRPWDFALNVNNLFNERSQRFKNQQSGETGETAVADFEGHPLPGRQIRISAMYKF